MPLDYRDPRGAKIRLGFDRLRANDRAHRVGSLILNPLLGQIPSAVLLTRDGDGHTSSWMHPSRTSEAIAHYLITRKTPPPSTIYPN